MCEIFIRANPASYQTQARSLRLHGVATSIRLESLFWEVLEELATRDGMTVNQLIARLHDELTAYRGSEAVAGNFSSFLRVCCLRYLKLQGEGRIPADQSVPIRSLDARAVLNDMPESWVEARPRQAFSH
ncbi:ribbon-helix-helix domain-containing protein [Cupriavidus consociatus]|uniref:ribbon-helix-helix domain-containing protein n=1 Tax=Cupriavidus consociatus TaxID=2821357 RepID=UPI001AE1D037|nr:MULTISPECIES: ribbon-helix-helix domain-containing protein [unclassified Cupriavidus]MBP0620052.1 ribbon-helix-helix domain-containing protein [Cupriavidus sp. LEh25]MDK2656707.1 ribbon-helix-helix domain-containing protein [Cupriavidus sp. LEh21]